MQRLIVMRAAASRATFATSSKAVKFQKHGAPASVLKVESESVPGSIGSNEVLVKMNAFPITSGDIRQIEGYLGTSKQGGVAGREGVATVLKVGASVKHLSVNDTVVPSLPSFGTWREMAVVNADHVHSIPSSISKNQAALLGPSTGTALRLLSDFANLKKGDWIVQNGADGAVGQAVIQLAKAKGIKTLNVVRGNAHDGPNVTEKLQGLGADFVFPESYVMTPEFKRLTSDLPKPKLGINCVGGDSAANLSRTLAKGAHLVTYGSTSRNAVTVPTSVLVSKDITMRGFSYESWAASKSFVEREAMIKELVDEVTSGRLQVTETSDFSFGDFQKALKAALDGHYSNEFSEYFQKKVVVNL